VKIALWSPRQAAAGSWVTTLRPELERESDVLWVSEASADRPTADLDLYEIANEPDHAFVYRAALERPGVVVLRDFGLHDLVAQATLGRGDLAGYLREMRRAHGETGTFVGRQVARGLGGRLLPSLFAVNDRLLETSLGIVATTESVRSRAARRLPGRPTLTLPLDFLIPEAPPRTRADARHRLGLPAECLLVVAAGRDAGSARLASLSRAVESLRPGVPALRLVWLGPGDGPVEEALGVAGGLTTALLMDWLAAADVVAALRFPAGGGLEDVVVRALEVGRPLLVTAGTPPSVELPPGTCVAVDPDGAEEAELRALLAHLLAEPGLRERLGEAARAHFAARRDAPAVARSLQGFLHEVLARKPAALAAFEADRAREGTLLGDAMEEVRWGARDLGLVGVRLGLEPLLADLLGRGPEAGATTGR
jgi:hypothetical protein